MGASMGVTIIIEAPLILIIYRARRGRSDPAGQPRRYGDHACCQGRGFRGAPMGASMGVTMIIEAPLILII